MLDDIAIELTRFCDKACRHCGTDGRFTREYDASSMTLGTVLRILEQVAWTNQNRHMTKIRTVHLTGGEPLMWQDNGHKIGDAVRAVQEHGFRPQILTSGTCPSDRGFERYTEGAESLAELKPFTVYHSFNLYMAGTDIVTRAGYSIELFDDVFGKDRTLGFFAVFDRSNFGATLNELGSLMESLGYRFLKSKSTRNWREESKKGQHPVELVYKNGKRKAEVEFCPIDACAGRSRKSKLRQVQARKDCYLLELGIEPVIGYTGDVYPCWAGPYSETQPLGNIHDDSLSTIFGRERAHLRAFKECIDAHYNGRIDICRFCISVFKDYSNSIER